MIYDSVPLNSISSLKGDKYALKVILYENKGKFFTAKFLAQTCNFPFSITFVELRRAITELLELEGCPIVANKKGFSWADSKEMVVDYWESLLVRKKGLERRIRSVEDVLIKCY